MQQGPAARIVLHQQLHHVLCPVRVTPSESLRAHASCPCANQQSRAQCGPAALRDHSIVGGSRAARASAPTHRRHRLATYSPAANTRTASRVQTGLAGAPRGLYRVSGPHVNSGESAACSPAASKTAFVAASPDTLRCAAAMPGAVAR